MVCYWVWVCVHYSNLMYSRYGRCSPEELLVSVGKYRGGNITF